MALTITEKILLTHTSAKSISAGDFIDAKVDIALGNDITAPLAIKKFRDSGAKRVFNKSKVALVCDHFVPNKDAQSARQVKFVEDFGREQRLEHLYPLGSGGIEHVILPEKKITLPGQLIIGADSHTCTYGALGAFSTGMGSTDLAAAMITGKVWLRVPETMRFVFSGKLKPWVGGKDLILYTIGDIGVSGALYRAMEFAGPVIRRLGMDARFSMCNMAIEAGGKSGIIEPDAITLKYLGRKRGIIYKSDKNAKYQSVREYDVTRLEPQVACPHLPSNVKGVSTLKKVSIDQSVIGSCTNGRMSDLIQAAKILKGHKANSRVRLLIFPGSQEIYKKALRMGIMEVFAKANAAICPPTCGPCLGGHMGILADREVAIATTNRNFKGRMGSLKSKVYLSNPAVAAASAIKGKITHPNEI